MSIPPSWKGGLKECFVAWQGWFVSCCSALVWKALRLHSLCLGIPRGSSGSNGPTPTAPPEHPHGTRGRSLRAHHSAQASVAWEGCAKQALGSPPLGKAFPSHAAQEIWWMSPVCRMFLAGFHFFTPLVFFWLVSFQRCPPLLSPPRAHHQHPPAPPAWHPQGALCRLANNRWGFPAPTWR